MSAAGHSAPGPAGGGDTRLAQLTWSLDAQLRELQGTVAGLAGANGRFKTEVERLAKDNGELKAEIAALKTAVAKLEGSAQSQQQQGGARGEAGEGRAARTAHRAAHRAAHPRRAAEAKSAAASDATPKAQRKHPARAVAATAAHGLTPHRAAHPRRAAETKATASDATPNPSTAAHRRTAVAPVRTSAGDRPGSGPRYVPFDEALAHARSLNLAGQKEWYAWSKSSARPPTIAACPHKVYKDVGWQGYGHWLGTGNVRPGYPPKGGTAAKGRTPPSAAARARAETKAAASNATPKPSTAAHRRTAVAPVRTSAGDRPGSGPRYVPFDEALAHARALGLANMLEWQAWSKSGARPPTIAACPHHVYKDVGWQGYGHWLGTGNVRPGYPPKSGTAAKGRTPPSAAARARTEPRVGEHVGVMWDGTLYRATVTACDHSVQTPYYTVRYEADGTSGTNLTTAAHGLAPLPPRLERADTVASPAAATATATATMGAHDRRKKSFLPFGQALAYIRSLGLEKSTGWAAWSKSGSRPSNVPSQPSVIYKDAGWQGWDHWLNPEDGSRGGTTGGTASAPGSPGGTAKATATRGTPDSTAAPGTPGRASKQAKLPGYWWWVKDQASGRETRFKSGEDCYDSFRPVDAKHAFIFLADGPSLF